MRPEQDKKAIMQRLLRNLAGMVAVESTGSSEARRIAGKMLLQARRYSSSVRVLEWTLADEIPEPGDFCGPAPTPSNPIKTDISHEARIRVMMMRADMQQELMHRDDYAVRRYHQERHTDNVPMWEPHRLRLGRNVRPYEDDFIEGQR